MKVSFSWLGQHGLLEGPPKNFEGSCRPYLQSRTTASRSRLADA
jgi:hypothetical protein